MAVDQDLEKHLNLLRDAPDFVLAERADGQLSVTSPDKITPDMGVVWLAADLNWANGDVMPAVVVLNTDTGASERTVYVWSGDAWFEPAYPTDRAELLAQRAANEADLFPYQWTSHVTIAPAAGRRKKFTNFWKRL